jgi:o-succinylbenzoate synthase
MSVRARLAKKIFHFNFRARTSRGAMKDKTSWFIKLFDESDPSTEGWGECGPLPGLSVDSVPEFESRLTALVDAINASELEANDSSAVLRLVPRGLPSITFGVETALLDLLNGGRRIIYDNSFIRGEPIAINGLIWMGDMDFLLDQVSKKVTDGFRCLKLKVGGLDFERECDVLRYIRKRYFREDITIRLDANGAFKTDDVLYKLEEFAKFGVHSIEQPLKPGHEVMEELCRKSPIPVAFDEELIGVEAREQKAKLLSRLKPQFIVLKPTLHGGLSGCDGWIAVAQELGIGWWITSALESSIGLNAICQFTSNYQTTLPQGLGTGGIYENNISSPLKVKNGRIYCDPALGWPLDPGAQRA